MNKYYQSAIINMKYIVAVIVLCALQSSLVLGRTPDEVIEDFRPLILELHNILGRETYNLDNEIGQNYINEYQKDIGMLNQSMHMGLNYMQNYIEEKIDAILVEYNMTSHDDHIQHCLAQKDTGKTEQLQAAVAGWQACMQLVDIDIDYLKTILNDYKNKQYPMHSALEDSVHTCKRNSGNGLDMVSCLVEHIIVQVAPQVGQTLKDMKTNISGMSSIVEEKLDTVYPCFDLVAEKAEGSTKDIIVEFLECCVVASQNN